MEGCYETVESMLFLKLLKLDNIVLDVGANIIYYTILAASQVGKNGRIFAFEPVNITFSRLNKNVGNIEFVETINAACGKDSGYVDIFISDYRVNGNSGCS